LFSLDLGICLYNR